MTCWRKLLLKEPPHITPSNGFKLYRRFTKPNGSNTRYTFTIFSGPLLSCCIRIVMESASSANSSGPHAILLSDCHQVFGMSTRGVEYALCTICNKDISLAGTGSKPLTKHCKSDRHIRFTESHESASGKSYESVYESVYSIYAQTMHQ